MPARIDDKTSNKGKTMSKVKTKSKTRSSAINSRINTCPDCNFTALFMYVDAAGCPLCPKCSAADIQAFKDATKDIDEDFESFDDESLEVHEFDGIDLSIDELDFTEEF